MASIEKEGIVNVPSKKIFEYILKPGNWLEFWPSLAEITNVQSLPNGGYSAQWAYKMAGMRFKGKAQYTEVVPDKWLVVKTTGGINCTVTWTFHPSESRTKVTFAVDYKIPIPLLGKLAEFIIVKMNEREAALIISNLQIRFMFMMGNH